jgi:hypothetical protein
MGTRKPCPGCGKDARRSTGSVCDECVNLIRLGRAVQEERRRKEDGPHLYRLTREWPGFYRAPATLMRAFEELARASLRPCRIPVKPYDESVWELPASDPKHGVNYFSTYDERAEVWAGTTRLGMAIERLDREVRGALSEAYRQGEEDGQNLLRQIAGGAVSVAELTEKSIEAGRRRK